MSLVSCQQVAVQNGCVPEINTSLTSVSVCQSMTVIPSDKVTDTGTGSIKAQKILQYGSRHTIQNTGWTTRLSCDPSPRRNAVGVQKLPLPPLSVTGLKPLYPRLPFLSISQPTVLKLQPTAPAAAVAANSGKAIQVVGCTDNWPVGLPSSVAQCTVTSGSVLQTILAQPQMSANALSSSSTSVLNHALLTMPTVDSNTTGKPATVCFIPVSSVICGPVAGLPTNTHIMENMPATFAVSQEPNNFVGVHNLTFGPLLTQSFAGSKTVKTDAATEPVSSASALSAKELLTWTSNGQASCVRSVRMLTVKVHIDNGHITEVVEVPQKQREPQATPNVVTVHLDTDVLTSTVVSGAAVAGQTCMDHVDTNGAQFGYHDLIDGTRIRIARDTSGQRHAPVFLLSKYDDLCHFEEYTIELATSTNTESQVVPEEADVSEVGTVFTYEPLYVSEQTLVPVPRKQMRPYDSTVSESGNESDYYYRCYLCSFVSDDHVEVCRHWVNVHLTELPYRCSYCDRTFFTSTKAQVHIQRQHKDRGLTTVAFQRSTCFANNLSYQLIETDTDTDEDSDSNEGEEQQIVLEHCNQRPLKRKDSVFQVFGCHKCHFKTRSSVEMRQHMKFVHGRDQFKLVRPSVNQQQDIQISNVHSYGTNHLLPAEIATSNIAEKLTVDGECRFQCRWCAFQAKNASAISLHVLQDHHWPAAVLCPSCSCNLQLTDDDRKSTSIVCYSCKAKILLAPSTDSYPLAEVQDVVYMCNICAFKTKGKGSMCRHIKYNHTKCRPYSCVYCNYVAVERAQVKMHITDNHPDQSVIIKERTESNDQFRYLLDNLFSKLVSVQTNEVTGLQLNEDSDVVEYDSGRPVASSDVDSPLFTCEECKLETSSLVQLIRHQHHFHRSTLAANAAMVPAARDRQSGDTTAPAGGHFKCKLCGYCCLDRSCMSRHVKYMHITARPHSCVYCSYNNVEKTKVRLHVMAHHPGRQKTVRTDYKVLEDMSWQAKHFYVRIDHRGQVVDEISRTVNNCSPVDRPSAASPSSSDSELPEDFLTDKQPEHHDVRVNNADSSLVKKEVTGHDDDDVDVDFYPRRSRVDGASLNSIVMVDHNYFRISSPDNLTAAVTVHSDGVMIKEEPLDFEYEDTVSGMLCSEFSSRYVQPENEGHAEVKTETTDDFYSNAFNSLVSAEMSDSDSDEFYDSEKSDDVDAFDSEYFSDSESCSDTNEPVRKKIRVAFGVDAAAEGAMTAESVIIDSDVWKDPKMHMTPVVELEDVLQIILAWQQNTGETNDIM